MTLKSDTLCEGDTRVKGRGEGQRREREDVIGKKKMKKGRLRWTNGLVMRVVRCVRDGGDELAAAGIMGDGTEMTCDECHLPLPLPPLCLSLWLSPPICVYVCLCLSVYLFIGVSVCLPVYLTLSPFLPPPGRRGVQLTLIEVGGTVGVFCCGRSGVGPIKLSSSESIPV